MAYHFLILRFILYTDIPPDSSGGGIHSVVPLCNNSIFSSCEVGCLPPLGSSNLE